MRDKILYTGLDISSYKDNSNVIHYPLIKIDPVSFDDPNIQKCLEAFDSFTHIIFTSKTAFKVLLEMFNQKGFNPSVWKNKIILSVGKATARYIQENGVRCDYIADNETAEGVVELLEKLNLNDGYLFWPHSVQARGIIKEYLEKRNLNFCECSLYQTHFHKPQWDPNFDQINEIVFTSPSTVNSFFYYFGSPTDSIKITTIGPITNSTYLKLINNR